MPLLESQRVHFLGLNFDLVEPQALLAKVLDGQHSEFSYIVTPNAALVVLADSDPEFKSVMVNAPVSVCDSQIIRALSQIAGRGRLPLVTGSDLVKAAILSPAAKSDMGLCFGVIGGEDHQIEFLRRHFGIRISAHLNPPMGFLKIPGEMKKTVEFMKNNSVDIWFLTVGTPQQELLANAAYKDSRMSGTALCVGAAIDFVTGAQRRAPAVISSLRIEWLWRLIHDPKKMWRRYLVESPQVFFIFFREIFMRRDIKR